MSKSEKLHKEIHDSKTDSLELYSYYGKEREFLCILRICSFIVDSLILEDVSGVHQNLKKYKKQARKCKININPILGCNMIENERLIKKLFAKYKIKSVKKRF